MLGALGGALLLGLVAHAVLFAVLAGAARRTDTTVDGWVVQRSRGPVRVLLPLLLFRLALPGLPIEEEVSGIVAHVLGILLTATVTWLLIALTAVIDQVVSLHYPLDVADNLEARQVQTRVKVLRRIAVVMLVVMGVGVALMTFPQVREIGASLLASAGIAGLVAGIAARPVLSNLIAGVQIALTGPIRLDDVVIVEGEWGRIEEIRTTYVVVKIWDQRRMVVPLTWFIEKPFQNWTRSTSELLATVFLWVDHGVPLDEMRAELKRIVEASPSWDGRVQQVVVVETSERAMQVRCLVSAADSGKAWDLRCEVREELIGWLQRNHPDALPRIRVETATRPGSGGARP